MADSPYVVAPNAAWKTVAALNALPAAQRAAYMAAQCVTAWSTQPAATQFNLGGYTYTITAGPRLAPVQLPDGGIYCKLQCRVTGTSKQIPVDNEYLWSGLSPLVADGHGGFVEDWIAALQQAIAAAVHRS